MNREPIGIEAERTQVEGELPVLGVLADTLRVYRHHWKLLIPLALVVLLPQALANAVEIRIDLEGLDLGRAALAALAATGIVTSNLAGEALYAGLITGLVVEWRHGIRRFSLGRLIKELPLLRLIVADVLITAGVALGLVLLVVPGIVFAVYTVVTTVVIELEDRSIRGGFERSFSLVRGSFLRVFAIGLLLIAGTELISGALLLPFHHFAAEAAVHLGVEALIEPFQGVAIVLVALGLMELRGESPPERASATP